ncbi:MAG: hypothetical protein L0K86_22780 [Actinomycetia bacterium]|nr:hypothetical protein [Actinomycetes bacterium]
MHPDFEVIAATVECRDGNCPTVARHRVTGAVRVRGYDPADPNREIDVDIPATAWAQILADLTG